MSNTNSNKKNRFCSLDDAAVGQPVRIRELCGDPAVCHRLREMGFCEYAEVCKIAHTDTLICRLQNSKIALSRHLAENILVENVSSKP